MANKANTGRPTDPLAVFLTAVEYMNAYHDLQDKPSNDNRAVADRAFSHLEDTVARLDLMNDAKQCAWRAFHELLDLKPGESAVKATKKLCEALEGCGMSLAYCVRLAYPYPELDQAASFKVVEAHEVFPWLNSQKANSSQEESTTEAIRKSALEAAIGIVHGDREQTYGHPVVNLDRIAKIWSVVFKTEVTAEQVAWAMVGLKMAREVNKVSEDNLVDAIGYLALIDRCRLSENEAA